MDSNSNLSNWLYRRKDGLWSEISFGCEIMICDHYEIFRLRGKWNEINPPTPAGISHGEAIFHTQSVFHKSRKGFISLKRNKPLSGRQRLFLFWSRRLDLNQRPFGPEPNALPNCATPRMEPMWGFEPQTCALRVRRSTYWATLALPTVHKYSIKNLFCHYFFQKKHDIFHIFFVETFLLKIRVSCASTQ